MKEAIADWFTTGVDAIICGTFLVFIALVLSSTIKINTHISEQQAITQELGEYREHNQYDHTIVYPQDVVSAVYKYRGEPAIRVLSSRGAYQWTTENVPCDYTTVEISALIDQTVVYDAAVVYGGNGEVIAYEFKAK